MLSTTRTFALMAALAVAGFAASANAGERPPSSEERAAIEAALTQHGFTSWKEIELDDGKWEIDDAVHTDGKKYDVDLDPGSLNVIKQTLDDD